MGYKDAMSDYILITKNLAKSFSLENGEEILFSNINLKVKAKEFISIIGKSGCGKSTLLRILCGIDDEYYGEIIFNHKKKEKPNRNIILMYQDYNQLFYWQTVLENIMVPLLATKLVKSREEALRMARMLLEEIQLSKYADYYPQNLSGGMRQRVSFARAIALKPKILLLDEPFSSLDDEIREEMQMLLKRICKIHQITVIFVTHNINEAKKMSDKIMLIEDGRLRDV